MFTLEKSNAANSTFLRLRAVSLFLCVVRLSSLFFLFPAVFGLRDEFLLLYGVTRYTSWSYSHEVTTFLTLDNVYILVCTDWLVFSDVYISLVVGIGLFRPNKRQVTSGFAPYTKSVERNARDTKVTPRECLKALDGRGSFLFSGCRPRFSRLAASPLDARPRALLSLNLKEN